MSNAELITVLREAKKHFWTQPQIELYPMMEAAADALEAAEKRIKELEPQAAFFDAEKLNYQENIEYRDERIKELEAQMPKEGEWRGLIIDGQYWAITCSNCHQVGFNARTPYCPNCGAKMKGANDEET